MSVVEPELQFVRAQPSPFANRHDLARAAKSGVAHRVARGAYLPVEAWAVLNDDEKYLALIRAVAATRRFHPVLSHWSAAAIHGLPVVGRWPTTVHTIVGRTAGGRSRNRVAKHSLRVDDIDIVQVGNFFVTSVARTVLDMAAVASPMVAVTMADRALHVDRQKRRAPLTTKAELFAVWERSLPARAHARTRRVIEFSTALADSPLESVSRVNMEVIGCPRPKLQSRFSDYRGFVAETDFNWPSFNLVGEADGDIKYLDVFYRNGRSSEQVIVDERVRENRLRALKLEVTRWRWSIAVNPAKLRAHLRNAGLPIS